MKRFPTRRVPAITIGGLALVTCASIAFASSSANNSSGSTVAASPAHPYAAWVVANSNDGLEEQLIELGVSPEDAAELVKMELGGMSMEQQLAQVKLKGVDIPDVSTTGLLCQLLTLQPAQGCLETQLSGCTTQWFCTSETWDNCTNGDWCTAATICTNTQGCTDAGVCTKENGCTGGNYCTASAGCTQHDASCTHGERCTHDHGLCTGGDTCTKGTGCTNGTKCTAGLGCTKDAQCTDGANCTKGSNCTRGFRCTTGPSCPTSGNKCTQWTICPSPSPTPNPKTPQQVAGTPVSGVPLDVYLDAPGTVGPDREPHLKPGTSSLASLGWLGLLLLPGLALRRRT
jgi:hypothetical protein